MALQKEQILLHKKYNFLKKKEKKMCNNFIEIHFVIGMIMLLFKKGKNILVLGKRHHKTLNTQQIKNM